jgi:hypothetical protein
VGSPSRARDILTSHLFWAGLETHICSVRHYARYLPLGYGIAVSACEKGKSGKKALINAYPNAYGFENPYLATFRCGGIGRP